MLKRILPVFLVMIAALLMLIVTRPATYHVERSTLIAAPAGRASKPDTGDVRGAQNQNGNHKRDRQNR